MREFFGLLGQPKAKGQAEEQDEAPDKAACFLLRNPDHITEHRARFNASQPGRASD